MASLAVALILAGCAAAGPVVTPAAPSEAGGAVAPWAIPSTDYPAQTLFRMDAETADGDAAVRIVLRLERPERYRLTLSDRLGRTLYTVDLDADGGWLLDHRAGRGCRLEADGEPLVLRGVPLQGFSPAVLPAVLLGRAPSEPVGPVARGEGGQLTFRDREGRRWSVRAAGSDVLAWTLWRAGEPVLWWRRDGERALLSDRLRGAQLRWQAVAREGLAGRLPEPALPDGFARGDCAPSFDSSRAGL